MRNVIQQIIASSSRNHAGRISQIQMASFYTLTRHPLVNITRSPLPSSVTCKFYRTQVSSSDYTNFGNRTAHLQALIDRGTDPALILRSISRTMEHANIHGNLSWIFRLFDAIRYAESQDTPILRAPMNSTNDSTTNKKQISYFSYLSPKLGELDWDPLLHKVLKACISSKAPDRALEVLQFLKHNLKRSVKPFLISTYLHSCKEARKFPNIALITSKDNQNSMHIISLIEEFLKYFGVEDHHDVTLYNTFMMVANHSGNSYLSLEILYYMFHEKGFDAETIIQGFVACRKLKNTRRAMEILRYALAAESVGTSFYLNAKAYTAAILAFSSGSQWYRGLELYRFLHTRATKDQNIAQMLSNPRLHLAALVCCATGKVVEDAFEILRNLQDSRRQGNSRLYCEPNIYHYSSVLTVCGRTGSWEKAVKLIEEMESSPYPQDRPSSFCYASAIMACRRAHKIDEAHEILKKMENSDVRPTTYSYNSLLSVYANSGYVKEVMRTIDKMKTENVKRDAVTYAEAMNAYAIYADFNERFRNSNAFKSDQEDNFHRSSPLEDHHIDDSERHPILEKALNLLEDMKKEDIEPNLIVYNNLLKVCANLKDANFSLKVLTSMESIGLRPDLISFNSVLTVLADTRDSNESFKILEKMERLGIAPDSCSLNSILKALHRNRDWVEMQDFVSKIPKIYGMDIDTIGYNFILCMYLNSGRIEDAENLLKRMKKEKNADAGSFNLFITAYAHAQQYEKIEPLLHDMEISGIKKDLYSYMGLLRVAKLRAELDEMVRLIGAITREFKDSFKINKVRSYMLRSLHMTITSLNQNGRWKDALKLFSRMKSEGLKADSVLYELIQKLMISQGLHEDLKDLNKEMYEMGIADAKGNILIHKDHFRTSREKNSVIPQVPKSDQWLLSTPDLKAAARLLQPLEQFVLSRCVEQVNPNQKSEFLQNILLAHVQDQKWEAITKAYDKVVGSSSKSGFIDHSWMKETFWSHSIVLAFAKMQKWDILLNIIDDMKRHTVSLDRCFYMAALASHTILGRFSSAVNLLSEMTKITGVVIDSGTCISLMEAFLQKGSWSEALDIYQIASNGDNKLGAKLNIFVRNCALEACAAGKKWEFALDVYNDIKIDGIVPNSSSLKHLLNSCEDSDVIGKKVILREIDISDHEMDKACLIKLLEAVIMTEEWGYGLVLLQKYPIHKTCTKLDLRSCRYVIQIFEQFKMWADIKSLSDSVLVDSDASCISVIVGKIQACRHLGEEKDMIKYMERGLTLLRKTGNIEVAASMLAVANIMKDQDHQSAEGRAVIDRSLKELKEYAL